MVEDLNSFFSICASKGAFFKKYFIYLLKKALSELLVIAKNPTTGIE